MFACECVLVWSFCRSHVEGFLQMPLNLLKGILGVSYAPKAVGATTQIGMEIRLFFFSFVTFSFVSTKA